MFLPHAPLKWSTTPENLWHQSSSTYFRHPPAVFLLTMRSRSTARRMRHRCGKNLCTWFGCHLAERKEHLLFKFVFWLDRSKAWARPIVIVSPSAVAFWTSIFSNINRLDRSINPHFCILLDSVSPGSVFASTFNHLIHFLNTQFFVVTLHSKK